MLLTQKDAKTMAKSLRDALGFRNVPLTHSECLEIVARQFGVNDWNTLVAKLRSEESEEDPPQTTDPALQTKVPADTAISIAEPATKIVAPWTTCSFCGKSTPEVRILLGGCGGWEGFRARRNPESGERSNVFLCNECIELCGRIATRMSSLSPASA